MRMSWKEFFKPAKGKLILLGIVLLVVIVVFAFTVEKNERYMAVGHTNEFNELNKCYSDAECLVGQEDVGTDLSSPSSKCVTKKVIDRFDDWFEFRNKEMNCGCNLTSNRCYHGQTG